MDTQTNTAMAKSLRILMQRLEDLLLILHQERIVYFPDWGTLLGVARHKNVIPWDYDVDICLPNPDYLRLIAHFEAHGNQIGQLVLRKAYYDDPDGAVAILFADVPDETLGIDVVSYHRTDDRVLNDMSPQLQADYPGDYDLPVAGTLPLRWDHLLGLPILMPMDPESRLRHLFGNWQAFPDGHQPSALTTAPFVDMAERPGRGPWIARSDVPPLDPGDGWTQPGYVTGMRVVRWVSAEAAAAADVDAGLLQALTFTELVFHADRALWGQVHVGTLFPGDLWHEAEPGLAVVLSL